MVKRIALAVLIAFIAGGLAYGLGYLLITVNQSTVAALGALLKSGCTFIGVAFGLWYLLTGRTDL
jgi:p-aminobenzoyl-glutamate transporter AbgT